MKRKSDAPVIEDKFGNKCPDAIILIDGINVVAGGGLKIKYSTYVDNSAFSGKKEPIASDFIDISLDAKPEQKDGDGEIIYAGHPGAKKCLEGLEIKHDKVGVSNEEIEDLVLNSRDNDGLIIGDLWEFDVN